MNNLLQKIKSCQTSKELDLLRVEIARDTDNFDENQKAFIKQKNKLKRNGHTANTEGYSMVKLLKEQAREMKGGAK